jgi:hypothetical protein
LLRLHPREPANGCGRAQYSVTGVSVPTRAQYKLWQGDRETGYSTRHSHSETPSREAVAVLKDFVIADDSAGIEVGDWYLDMHNEYDLVQIRMSQRERTAELEFICIAASRAPGHPHTVVLQFTEVDWFQTSPKILDSGSGGVLEIGYKEPSDTAHDWLIRERQANPNAHLFFRLTGDEFLRVHARRARILLPNS